MLCQWDQLDPSSLASVEILVRRVHQIEIAVKKNPKQPDYEGLESLLETAVDSSGSAVLPGITTWLAERQKDEAFVLKQSRLWADEKRLAGSGKNKKEPPGGAEK